MKYKIVQNAHSTACKHRSFCLQAHVSLRCSAELSLYPQDPALCKLPVAYFEQSNTVSTSCTRSYKYDSNHASIFVGWGRMRVGAMDGKYMIRDSIARFY